MHYEPVSGITHKIIPTGSIEAAAGVNYTESIPGHKRQGSHALRQDCSHLGTLMIVLRVLSDYQLYTDMWDEENMIDPYIILYGLQQLQYAHCSIPCPPVVQPLFKHKFIYLEFDLFRYCITTC